MHKKETAPAVSKKKYGKFIINACFIIFHRVFSDVQAISESLTEKVYQGKLSWVDLICVQ